MLDTSVAILLRDRDVPTVARIASNPADLFLSIISRVELEGGVYRYPDYADTVRMRLAGLYSAVEIVDFDVASADAYGRIIAATGYSRRKILDRMIAAQAIVHGVALATKNPGDFTDIPGLTIEVW